MIFIEYKAAGGLLQRGTRLSMQCGWLDFLAVFVFGIRQV
ncbi:hypothetical protein STRDD11_01666 [Streptococcus sp. DD11]|nr:hypothetical protein STRDD11_01666 [Streptococcus sp. DD11]